MLMIDAPTLELAALSLDGCYPGVVVSAADPDKGGRVRVRVDQAYGATTESEFIPDDQLPWARPGFGGGADMAPPKGSAVWVMFWGGSREKPVYFSGMHALADVPKEFTSSYEGGAPRTRLVKTENGHVFEMRWQQKDSFIRFTTANGSEVRITDDVSHGGAKIEVQTPLRKMLLDDIAGVVKLADPTQSITMDATGVAIVTPLLVSVMAGGAVNVQAGGAATVAAAGAATVSGASVSILSTSPGGTAVENAAGLKTGTFVGLVALIFLGAVTWTLAGIFTITGAGSIAFNLAGALSFLGLSVTLGKLGGTFLKLLNETYHTTIFLPHTHVAPVGGGPTSVVSTIYPAPTLAAAMTADTKAS